MEKIMIPNELDYGNRCMEGSGEAALVWQVPASRLDDRIRQLCARVVTSGEEDLGPAISELKAALREHNRRLRKLAADTIAFLWSSREEASTKDPTQST